MTRFIFFTSLLIGSLVLTPGISMTQTRLRASYGAEKYERLVELKRRWDPENAFRLNQNIDPA